MNEKNKTGPYNAYRPMSDLKTQSEKVKKWKKAFPANGNEKKKKAGVAILTENKI